MEQLLENPELNRYTIRPIKHVHEWNLYKKAQESFWVEEDISIELVQDVVGWSKLSDDVHKFLEHVLAFFAISDGVVNETLSEEILSRIQVREIKYWYDFQIMMEDIHNTVYSQLIDTYIADEQHKAQLFNSIATCPTIAKKVEWIHKWLGKRNDLAKLSAETRDALSSLETIYSEMAKNKDYPAFKQIDKLFADLREPIPSLGLVVLVNVIVEGLFFSGSFAAIFWVGAQYPGLLPGLAKSNDYISRDEGGHTLYGIHIYKSWIKNKLSENLIHKMVAEAVNVETEFICAAMPNNLVGLNAQLMTEYIRFTANTLLKLLGYKPLFPTKNNPLAYTEKQSIGVRITDFFIFTPAEYGIAGANQSVEDRTLAFDEVF